MLFRRKKKVKAPRVDADKVIINAARTIGTAVGTASGAYEIGRKSAIEAKNIDTDGMKKAAVEKKMMATKKAEEMTKQAAKQAEITKKMAAKQADVTKKVAAQRADEAKKVTMKKADQAKKVTAKKAKEMQATATDKIDNVRMAAADAIAPKKKRGIIAWMR